MENAATTPQKKRDRRLLGSWRKPLQIPVRPHDLTFPSLPAWLPPNPAVRFGRPQRARQLP